MTAPLRKAANSNGRSITCQLRVGKNFCCTNRHLRRKHQVPGLVRANRGELLADAFGEGRAAAHEHRHIRAQRQAQLGQAVLAPVQSPEVVQADQGGRGIRTAASDAAAHGQALVQPDVGAQAGAGLFLQASRGAHDQVAVVGHAGNVGVQTDLPILAATETELVAVVEELEERLQLVIAVRTAAEDVQEQVELGRGGQD